MADCTCILDGKPHAGPLPEGAHFVGMECEPNKKPRYGKVYHPWFNKPCYETDAVMAECVAKMGEGTT